MRGILKLMVIEINIITTFQVAIPFHVRFLEEIIIMHSKLIEKYNNLAREALSTGDKILSKIISNMLIILLEY